MKILMTTDTVGGVWTYALELAGALARRNTQVTLATMGAPLTEPQWADAALVPGLEIKESRFKLEWMDDPWEEVDRAGEWLLELAAAIQPDLVHLNGYCHAALPWPCPTVVVAHSCVSGWWRAVKGEDAPEEWQEYRRRVTYGLHTATAVVAPTRAMLAMTEMLYGSLPCSLVIPNGRSAGLFSPRRKYPLLLAAGRLWDEAKNLEALSAVASALPWPVYIAGEEVHPVRGTGAPTTTVTPLGKLDPECLAEWMGKAAIYVLPARYEPFGLSVLEAALSGCALVLGDIPSLRENWQGAARFVSPDDREALAGLLQELTTDPGLCGYLGEVARERAARFRPEVMASAYDELYRKLLSQKTGAGTTGTTGTRGIMGTEETALCRL